MKRTAAFVAVCAILLLLCACGRKTTEIRLSTDGKEESGAHVIDAALFYSTEDGFLHKGGKV